MSSDKFELFSLRLSHGCILAESPVWDYRTLRLYWVDIDGRMLFRSGLADDSIESRAFEGRPGCIALTSEPDVVVLGIEQKVYKYSWASQQLREVAYLGGVSSKVRLNDGKCDRFGRLWIGSMHAPSSDLVSDGELFVVNPDGRFQCVKRHIGVSNGLAFSFDGHLGYFADTSKRQIMRFEIQGDTDLPKSERVLFDFQLAGLDGKPDGACVDEAGCYWVACGYGASVARITPDGILDRVVPVPVARPTSCAFGGPDLDLLFVTSIGGTGRVDSSTGVDASLAGQVLVTNVGVKGVIEGVFG